MSVENTNVIDLISIDKEGNVVLTVSDDLEWDNENVHLLKLQDKLNAYLDAVDNGSLYDNYPNSRGRNILINVISKYLPNEEGEQFLRRTKEILDSIGYQFRYSNLIK